MDFPDFSLLSVSLSVVSSTDFDFGFYEYSYMFLQKELNYLLHNLNLGPL